MNTIDGKVIFNTSLLWRLHRKTIEQKVRVTENTFIAYVNDLTLEEEEYLKSTGVIEYLEVDNKKAIFIKEGTEGYVVTGPVSCSIRVNDIHIDLLSKNLHAIVLS